MHKFNLTLAFRNNRCYNMYKFKPVRKKYGMSFYQLLYKHVLSGSTDYINHKYQNSYFFKIKFDCCTK